MKIVRRFLLVCLALAATLVGAHAQSATHLVVSVPATAQVGVLVNGTITAQDDSGNTDTTYADDEMGMFSSDAGAVFANQTIGIVNGVGTFQVTFATYGTQTVEGSGTDFDNVSEPVAVAALAAGSGASFGSVAVGASATQTVTIQVLTATQILGVAIASGYNEFTLASDACSATYSSVASCTVSVTFTPSAPGARSAPLVIRQNDGIHGESDVWIGLTGTGTASALGLLPAASQTLATSGATVSGASFTALDGAGNLYVSDPAHHQIYRITPAGAASVIAGTGSSGYHGDSGPATAAQLNTPLGLRLDAAGNLFIADSGNHVIRRVDVASGIIATVAGSGNPGNSGDGGPATAALLQTPADIALDAAGDLYIADSGNNSIRKVTPDGLIASFIASGLNAPQGLVVDPAGNLYIADTGNNRVLQATPAASVVTWVGSGLSAPVGIALDAAGDLYINDTGNHAVRRVDNTGSNPQTVASGLTLGAGVAASGGPLVYTADAGAGVIRVVNTAAATVPDFGLVAYPNSGIAASVTLTNLGNAGLNFSGVAMTGDFINPGTTCPSGVGAGNALPSGASCTLSLNFQPAQSDIGPLTGSAAVSGTMLAGGTTQTIALTGTGDGVLAVLNPTSHDFGAVSDGVASSAYSFNLSNPGTETLTGIAATFTGSNPGDFSVTAASTCGTSLAAGANCTFDVAFTPGATLARAATLTIASSAATQIAALTGSGQGGAATHFQLTASSPVTSGSQPTVVVTALDANGFLANLYSGTLQLTSPSDSLATASPAYTFLAADNGSHTFSAAASLTLASAGTQTITATDHAITGATTTTVTALAQTITFNALPDAAYGAAAITLAASATSGLAVSYAVTGPASLAGNILTITGAGTVGVTASQAGNASYAAAANVIQSFNVAKAALTVTAASPTIAFNQTVPAYSATITGFVNGETTTVVSGSPALSTSPATPSAVGTYPITATLGTLSATNYTFNFANGALTITQAAQSITFNALPDVTYGATPITLAATASSGLAITYAVTGPVSLAGNVLTITGAGSVGVTASQSGNASYQAATNVTQSFNVAKAPLAVTAASPTIAFNQALPAYSAAITGFVNGETATVVSGSPTLSTSPATPSAVGTYPITAAIGSLTAANYTFNFVNGTLTISQAAQTITFAALPDVTYGAAPITLTATASSGLAITYAVTGPASLAANILTISGAGSVGVTASQPGNASYQAATNVTQSFNVAKAALTVTAASPTIAFGQTVPAYTASLTGFVNGETTTVVSGSPALSTSPSTPSAVGTYPITATLGTLSATNYTFTFVNGTLTISQATQTITLGAMPDVTYGAAPIIVAATATSDLTVTYAVTGPASLAGNILTITGAGTVGVTASQAGNASYAAAANVIQSFNVAKVALTVTAASPTIAFNQTVPAYSATITGFVNGETTTVVSGSPALSTSPSTPSAVGTYPITATLGTLSATNYTFNFASGTLSITQGAQTITFSALPDVTYGATPITLAATATSGLTVTYAVTGPASLAGNVLTITGAGSVGITASQPGNTSYLAATNVIQSFNVAKAGLTVTAASPTIAFGQTVPAYTASIAGFVNSETAAVVSGSATLSTSPATPTTVGTYPITTTAGSLTAANYTFNFVNGTLTISQATQTITFGALPDATYGATPIPLTASASSGLAITYAVTGPASLAGNVLTVTGAGSVGITASQPGNASYQAATNVIQSFNVAKAALTVTAASPTIAFGQTVPAYTATITGFVNGETSAVVSGSASLATTPATPTAVGTYTITAATGSLSAANYTFAFVNGTFTISQATQTINFAALADVTYGATPITLAATATSGLTVTYAVTGPASLAGNVLTITGAGSVGITASQPGNTSYQAATSVTQGFNVAKAALAVTAASPTITFGQTVPAYSATITGFVNGETAAVVSGSATLSTSPATPTAVGTYPITAATGSLSAANYTFAFVNGTLTISQATQTIGFGALPDVTYGAAPITLTATASSGLAITYAVTGPASLAGNVLTITGAGSVGVTASQPGNTSYQAATNVTQNFNVAKAALTVTAASPTIAFGQTVPTYTASITGFVNNETTAVVSGSPALSTSPATPNAVGTYTITTATGSLSAANYTFNFVNGSLTISQATQTITFGALPDVVYGATPITLTAAASSGLPITYAITGPASLAGNVLTITGAGSVGITASQPGNASYSAATSVIQSFNVAKAGLTVTAVSPTIAFGQTVPAYTGTITGFVNGETAAVVSGSATLSTSPATPSAVGTYPITTTAGSLSAANYTFNFVNGQLTISQAVQTITFGTLPNLTYGAAPITLTATATSGLPITYAVTGPASLAGNVLTIAGAGSVGVTASQSGSTSYSAATNVIQSFNVAKAALTVTAASPTIAFGQTVPTYTANINGFVNGETSAVVSGSPALSTSPATPSAVGTYPITTTSGSLTAANYTFNFINGSLTISQATQTITFSALPDVVYGATPIALAATATSGLTVTYAVTGPASLAGNVLTIAGAGSVSITASQSGNASYQAATNVIQSFKVAKAALTVTASSPTIAFGQTVPTYTANITGYVNNDSTTVVSGTANLTTSPTLPSSVGTYPITAALGSLSAANYTFNFVNGYLNIVQAAQTITVATLPDVVYGAAPVVLATTTTSGLAATYQVTGPATLAGTRVTVNGVGRVVITASQVGNANYIAAPNVTIAFTVTPAVLTVTANPASATFGQVLPALSASLTGFVNADTAAVITGQASLATTPALPTAAGSYPIYAAPGTLAAANYTFAFVNGTLTIAPATQSIQWSAVPTHYVGDPSFSLPASSSSGLPVLVSVSAGPATSTANLVTVTGPGSVTLQATQAGNNNYLAAPILSQTFQVLAQAALGFSATALDFGSQPIGTSSSALTLSVNNHGTALAHLASITASGDFLSSNACATLAPLAACTVTVSFAPAALGTRSGSLTFTDDAGGSPQVIPLTGIGTAPGILLQPNQVAFGSQVVGSASSGQTVTIANTGSADLHLTQASTSGDFAASGACALVPAGSSCSLTVLFTPTALGARPGSLTLHDDAASGTQTINLSGTGSAAGASLAPAQLGFGPTLVGAISAPFTTFLTNTGTAPLTAISLALAGDFSLTNSCPSTLAAAASCAVTVNYQPTLAGAETGALTFSDSLGQQFVALSGTGITPGINLSATQITFGGELAGTSSSAQTVALANTGSAPLAIASLGVSAGFALNTNCGATLDAGASCSLNITFNPTAAGAQSGTLSLSDAIGTQSVALLGEGLIPGLALTPSSAGFGAQVVGATSPALTLTATNTGTAALQLNPVAVSGDFSESDQCPATLPPGASCQLSVAFAPSAIGTRAGTVSISDAAGLATARAALSGQATLPGLAVSPANLWFGSQPDGVASAAQTLTVTNSGTAPLQIGALAIIGDFSQSTNCAGATLAPGTYCVVNVLMTPTTTGTRTGTLQISDNADGAHQVALSGVGQAPGINLFPTALAFGSFPVAAGGGAITLLGTQLPVSLTNTGTLPLALSAMQLQGDFTASNNCGASLAPGANCTLSIGFVPTATGHRTGTLTLTDNAGGGSQSIPLQGDGSPNGLVLTPPVISFGAAVVNTTSPPQTAILANHTGHSITQLAITPSGEFSESDNCGTTLADGASCPLNITIAPLVSGAVTGTIAIHGTLGSVAAARAQPNRGSLEALERQRAPLPAIEATSPSDHRERPEIRSGVSTAAASGGTLGVVAATAAAIPATLAPSVPQLAFGAVTVGSNAVAQTLTLTNTGNSGALTGLAISAGNAAEFPWTSACSAALAAQASCTVQVGFAPAAAGPRSGTLTFTADGGITVSLPESGSGIGPLLAVAPSGLNFGPRPVATTSALQTLVAQNTGQQPLTLSSFAVTGADFALAGGTCAAALSLPVAATCTVAVTFTPQSTGARSGALTLVSNSTAGPAVIALSGSGTSAGLQFSRPSLAFGAQGVALTSPAQSLTLLNGNASALAISAITIAGDYTQTNTCGATLAAGGSCTVIVAFTPSATGERDTALTITNSAATQIIPVSGAGSDFALQWPAGTPVLAVAAGQSASATLSVASLAGDAQTVSFTCAADSGYTCTLAPPSVAAGAQPGSVTVTLAVASAAAAGAAVGTGWHFPTEALGAACLALLLLCGFGVGNARLPRRIAWPAGLAATLLLSAACGGAPTAAAPAATPTPTPAPTAHTATLSAVSTSNATHTLTINFTAK